jgi:hypothetical protein
LRSRAAEGGQWQQARSSANSAEKLDKGAGLFTGDEW